MNIILISILFIGIAVAGLAVKILLKKGGKFTGTCAGNNPMLQDETGGCPVCGARKDEDCRKEEK